MDSTLLEHNNAANLGEIDTDESVHETLVMDAVFAFAHALDTMCRQNSSVCSNSDSFDSELLLKHLLATSFDSLANGRIGFMSNGDSAGKYLIKYLQEIDGVYKYIPVGSWTDAGNNTEVITEENFLGILRLIIVRGRQDQSAAFRVDWVKSSR